MSDPTPHLERFGAYEQARTEFRWTIPPRLNIASAICRKHADAVARIALHEAKHAGVNTYTFGGLDFLSDKFAAALSESGITSGDSVVVILPQSAALAVAHLGVLKCGAVVVPLSMSAGLSLLEYALTDCGAKAVVVDESIYARVETSRHLPSPDSRFVVRDERPANAGSGHRDFWSEVDRGSSEFDDVQNDANSTAFILYIESQGNVTGVVHSQRSVIGQFSAFEMFFNAGREGDSVFWTPDDWSSPSAVLGVLYPAWWYGCSVVASTCEGRGSALRLMERFEVTHAFIASSTQKMFAESESEPGEPFDLKLQTIVSERVQLQEHLANSDLTLALNATPDVTMNCVYSKPGTGWVAGTCDRWFKTAGGSVGRPAPGRLIEIIDESGNILPPLKPGRIAVHKSDPALFSGFHNSRQRTAAAFIGDWFLTGDAGYKSEDGDLYILSS